MDNKRDKESTKHYQKKDYKNDNVFAKIIKGELSANIIYENDNVIAFHDIRPADDIHVLVVPKKPVVDFSDFVNCTNISEIGEFFKTIEYIAQEVLHIKEYKLITNNGKSADQAVFHLHFHIIAKDPSKYNNKDSNINS